MKLVHKLVGLAGVGALGLLATNARAERIVAAAGTEANEWEVGCFRHAWGQVLNVCAGQVPRLSVGVRAITGSRQFKATGCDAAKSGGDTSCAAVVTDNTGWVKWASGDVTLPGCSGGQGAGTVNLGAAHNVASGDAVVFECLIQEDATSSFVGTLDY